MAFLKKRQTDPLIINLVDLKKCCEQWTKIIKYLLANIGFDTAENEPYSFFLRGPYDLKLKCLHFLFTAQVKTFVEAHREQVGILEAKVAELVAEVESVSGANLEEKASRPTSAPESSPSWA